MCTPKIKWKDRRGPERRQVVREFLRVLAANAPDPFTETQARESTNGGKWGWRVSNYSAAFRFLRDHGFIARVGTRLPGYANQYELSEQAVRWLTWTGFDFAQRAA